MKIVLNHNEMEPKIFPRKLKINPWIGLIASLFIIIPSLYNVLDNTLILRIEHLILSIGILVFIKYLKQIFDKILDMSDEMD